MFDILNSFTRLYDDYWVYDNLKKIESQVIIKANIIYESFNDWIFIKNIIKKSNNVNYFRVSDISTKKTYARIKVINENKFITELESNNLSIKKNNNIWNIKKYY